MSRPVSVLPFLVALIVPHLAAQTTTDWARVTIGLSVGTRAGATLWDVMDQPVISSNRVPSNPSLYYPADLMHLHRGVSPGLTVSAQATFYSSPRFGLTFELTFLGLNMDDICTVTRDGGDAELATACAFVGSSQKFGAGTGSEGAHDARGVDHSGKVTLMQGGIILRPFNAGTLQPFFKALVGFANTPQSTLALTSTYGADSLDPAPISMVFYQDYSPAAIRPVFTAAAGLTTDPSTGVQFHLELRGTLLPQSVVTGPTASQNLQPPSHSVFKGYVSVLAGIELVLKRDRGKRY